MSRTKALFLATIGSILVIAPSAILFYRGYSKTGMLILLFIFAFISIHGIISSFSVKWRSDIPFALLCITFTIYTFAVLYQISGAVVESGVLVNGKAKPVSDLSNCLYFSVITWTTLGYGDLVPTGIARAIAAGEAVLGYLVSALLIALIVDRLGKRPR